MSLRALEVPTLEQVRAARDRIEGVADDTPLLRFETPGAPEIFLKLESLQPIGSFKLRGALSRMLAVPREQLRDGVYTASAGNMAQGVAWAARQLDVPATVIVPDTAPRAKLDAVARLGASVVPVPYDEWWNVMRNGGRPGMRGLFVHPFADQDVMAGNGTIALEILDEMPDVDAVFVPWGGGGLTCGIASAARALKPDVRIYACEVEGAAPLTASFAARGPVTIDNRRTFVDGIGGRGVFPEIWPLAQQLVTAALTVSTTQIADAVRDLALRSHVIAEGAGAAALAAVRAHAPSLQPMPRRVACVVSGANIDSVVLTSILSGTTP